MSPPSAMPSANNNSLNPPNQSNPTPARKINLPPRPTLLDLYNFHLASSPGSPLSTSLTRSPGWANNSQQLSSKFGSFSASYGSPLSGFLGGGRYVTQQQLANQQQGLNAGVLSQQLGTLKEEMDEDQSNAGQQQSTGPQQQKQQQQPSLSELLGLDGPTTTSTATTASNQISKEPPSSNAANRPITNKPMSKLTERIHKESSPPAPNSNISSEPTTTLPSTNAQQSTTAISESFSSLLSTSGITKNFPCCGIIHATFDDLLKHYEVVHQGIGDQLGMSFSLSFPPGSSKKNGGVPGLEDENSEDEDSSRRRKGYNDDDDDEDEDDVGAMNLSSFSDFRPPIKPAATTKPTTPTTAPMDIYPSHTSPPPNLPPPNTTTTADETLSLLLSQPPVLPPGTSPLQAAAYFKALESEDLLRKRRLSVANFSLGSYTGAELKKFREGWNMSGLPLETAADQQQQQQQQQQPDLSNFNFDMSLMNAFPPQQQTSLLNPQQQQQQQQQPFFNFPNTAFPNLAGGGQSDSLLSLLATPIDPTNLTPEAHLQKLLEAHYLVQLAHGGGGNADAGLQGLIESFEAQGIQQQQDVGGEQQQQVQQQGGKMGRVLMPMPTPRAAAHAAAGGMMAFDPTLNFSLTTNTATTAAAAPAPQPTASTELTTHTEVEKEAILKLAEREWHLEQMKNEEEELKALMALRDSMRQQQQQQQTQQQSEPPTPMSPTNPTPPTTKPATLKPFVCPHPSCGRQYKNANGLKYHLSHGHALDAYLSPTTPDLSDTFNSTPGLNIPTDSSPGGFMDSPALSVGSSVGSFTGSGLSGTRGFICPHCSKAYKNVGSLNNHMTNRHGVVQQPQGNADWMTPFLNAQKDDGSKGGGSWETFDLSMGLEGFVDGMTGSGSVDDL
ncbi:hypothetical protein HDV05_003995 [Chytridiales sp. JEL 0842]|nr:hypothetical protein HDV05_003995 [Chytridiales sp. JEL 0842]